jgi:hypothetical protein
MLANSCASLRPDDLLLGRTSKEESVHLAGCHGEGLKLAEIFDPNPTNLLVGLG